MKKRRLVCVALVSAACGPQDAPPELEVGSAALNGPAVLAFLNGPDATVEVLDVEVGLDGRAARNIVAHVRGPDARLGTPDDDLLDSIEELDAIKYVGEHALRQLDAYVRARAPATDAVEVEGVSLSPDEAAAVLRLANDADETTLDVDVGLDGRAARAIVAARPIADLEALAAVAWVGRTALERLKVYAAAHPPREGVEILHLEATVVGTTGIDVSWRAAGASECTITVGTVVDRRRRTPVEQTGLPVEGTMSIAWPDTRADTADVALLCLGGNYSAGEARSLVRAAAPRPGPVVVDCARLGGGSFDGVAFTAPEECHAVRFLNEARYSDMAAMTEVGRRTAYDCTPGLRCDGRTSRWESLGQYADHTGIGRTSVESLRVAMADWAPGGPRTDTVADLWARRAELRESPLHLDRAIVTRRTADQRVGSDRLICVEVRDAPDAPNYLTACLRMVNADSAPGCSGWPARCLDPLPGRWVQARGHLSAAREAPGGYRIVLNADGPRPL